jgi:2-iminobutanoate/2-iminopropanoate deaminase
VYKRVPENSAQHKTAGPYSPVLEIECSKLVVISGQAAIDPDGNIVGDTIKTQAEYTLNNCLEQLKSAGCTFENVFKVNVYMTDLDMWGDFNDVYKRMIPSPMPVRTAVGTKLLPGLLVEIEMWAAK